MTQLTTRRSLATAAVLAIGIIGLPVAASPTSAASTFVGSVMVAPIATSSGVASLGSPDAASDRFVSTVLARQAGSVVAPTYSNTDRADATESFVRRVLVRGKYKTAPACAPAPYKLLG